VWDGNYYALEVITRLGLEDFGGVVRRGTCTTKPVVYKTLEEFIQFGEELGRITIYEG